MFTQATLTQPERNASKVRSLGTLLSAVIIGATLVGTEATRAAVPSDHSNPDWLTDLGGTLFFAADDAESGRELWRSDGTAEGTTLLKDVRPGKTGSRESCCFGPEAGLTIVDDAFFFAADDGANGTELWMSDGTEEGTFLVKDIDPPGGRESLS